MAMSAARAGHCQPIWYTYHMELWNIVTCRSEWSDLNVCRFKQIAAITLPRHRDVQAKGGSLKTLHLKPAGADQWCAGRLLRSSQGLVSGMVFGGSADWEDCWIHINPPFFPVAFNIAMKTRMICGWFPLWTNGDCDCMWNYRSVYCILFERAYNPQKLSHSLFSTYPPISTYSHWYHYIESH